MATVYLSTINCRLSPFCLHYCWKTRKPGKSGKQRPTAAHMAGLTDHTWTFGELFAAVMVG